MREKVIFAVFVLLGLLIVFVLFFPAIDHHPDVPVLRAMTEATAIATATKAYHIEYGAFPTGSPAQIAATLSGQNSNHIVFIEMQRKSIGSDGQFIDPWGQAYALAFDGGTNVIVRSAGKDKVFGTPDDVEAER